MRLDGRRHPLESEVTLTTLAIARGNKTKARVETGMNRDRDRGRGGDRSRDGGHDGGPRHRGGKLQRSKRIFRIVHFDLSPEPPLPLNLGLDYNLTLIHLTFLNMLYF